MKDFRKMFKWFKSTEIPYKRLKDKSDVFPKVGQTYKKYTQPDYKEYEKQKGKGSKRRKKQRGKGRKKQRGGRKSIKRRR